MPARGPLITRLEPQPRNVALLTWIQSPLPTPQAIPPAQRDWPNPTLPKASYDLRGWIQAPLPAPQAIPFLQRDFPNPTLAKPSYDLRGWIQGPQPSPQAIPFLQRDWPNPVLGKVSFDLRGWIQAPQPNPQAIPFIQNDWPNPTLPKANYDLRGWIESPTPAPNLIPNAQLSWPNPTLPGRADIFTWTQSAQPIAVAPVAPFGPYDWPNPQQPRRSIDALTWTWSIPPAPVVVQNPPPFVALTVPQQWPITDINYSAVYAPAPAPAPFVPPVIPSPGAGGGPGKLLGKKRRRDSGPTMREDQVFGEQYAISPQAGPGRMRDERGRFVKGVRVKMEMLPREGENPPAWSIILDTTFTDLDD